MAKARRKTTRKRSAAKKRTTSSAAKKRKPLKVKSNGALRKAAGVNKNGKVNQAKVRAIAKGKGKNAARARFYLNVLKK
jgi:hypothetical protein